ncbi:MAG TPA: hypothetical protein VGJ29_21410 [Vicinamibacterales bacterium]
MIHRGIRASTTGAATILLSLTVAAGCAHRPAATTLRMPPPPRSKSEALSSQEGARPADRKSRDVNKELEKNGRREETDRPVGGVGTTVESTASTTGSIPPPAGWSSVVSTPMPDATSRGATVASAPSGARTGNNQLAHRHIAAAIAFAISFAVAIVVLPRWLGAR